MRKSLFIFPTLGLLFACSTETNQELETNAVSEEVKMQTQEIEQAIEKVDKSIEVSEAELEVAQTEIDSLLSNI